MTLMTLCFHHDLNIQTAKCLRKKFVRKSEKEGEKIECKGDPAAVLSVKPSADDAITPWYDLNGRRLNSQPTKKGLYIRNGKKVIIR